MSITNALGWTLLHFLWEGVLIAALLYAALLILRGGNAKARYAASCGALALMFASALATFMGALSIPERATFSPSPVSFQETAIASTGVQESTEARKTFSIDTYLPALVWLWIGGVTGMSIRSLGGWAAAQRFARRYTWPASAPWEARFVVLAQRLRASRSVKLVVSAIAQTPAVVGWLKPVVIVPAGIFAGLTTVQIEALLAHELAHIVRYDYLVNLLQTAAETLLFYHPAVWWVSKTIREERENCCDDLAVEVCGDRFVYVQALTDLEQMRQAPGMAMAANGGTLLSRIERLLKLRQPRPGAPSAWASAGVVVALILAGMAPSSHAQRPPRPPEPPAAEVDLIREALPTPPVPPADLLTSPADPATVSTPHPPAAPDKLADLVAPVPPAPPAAPKGLLAQARPAPPAPPATPATPATPGKGWLEQIQAEGYTDLTVDEAVSMRIHGVTPAYIRELRAAGMRPSVDQLIAFCIHGVRPDFVREIQSFGFSDLNADKLIDLEIHGVTPEFIREARTRFKKSLTLDQMVQLKITGVLE
jgi:beta-lactamase regulating signal transducer with metallopeptidase domain